ncbi:MAG: DNA polymerase III subunit beta [Patescibacteria group bacterium]
MYIECQKDKLSEFVIRAEKIANKNASLPILACLLLVAKDKNIIGKATNLEIGVEMSIPAKVNKEGVVAISANIFSQAINNLQGGKTVSLEEKNGFLVIKNDISEIQLKTQSPQDFPLIPKGEDGEVVNFKIKDFVYGLKTVIFSSSLSSIKPELGSVYVYPENQELVFVATDSFRLSEKRIVSKQINNFPSILIPQKNCLELIRVFDGLNEDANLFFGKNQINISTSTTHFTSRIVDGSFPDYKQIIPKKGETVIHCLKQDLFDGLKAITVVFDKFNQVTFDTKIKEGFIILSSKNTDVGEGECKLKIKGEGEDIVISFNQQYIKESFSGFTDDSITLTFGGPHKPLLIEGGKSSYFRYLVMPMNR